MQHFWSSLSIGDFYMRRVFVYFLLFVTLFASGGFTAQVSAQSSNSSGIAIYIKIQDKTVHDGDIITLAKNGYVLGKVPYDPNIFGVVVANPAVAFEDSEQ